MEEPWSLHFSGLGLFTIVGPNGASLTSARSFLPGRPNAVASDEGWAFLALPPGTYQLLFEGSAIQFALAGAQYFSSEAVPIGQGPTVGMPRALTTAVHGTGPGATAPAPGPFL